ncbi:MAG: ATP-dependent helicase, partial [Gammaproteobacteria bacterium]|nr:ATP-dependent helicase [Gammaproteobacteria bacterium]
MNYFDIGLLPSGHLHGFSSATTDVTDNREQTTAIEQAFSRSAGEGLFSLAAIKSGAGLSPSLQYWRSFASQYLSERCLQAPAEAHRPDPIEPFTDGETGPLLLSAPPMRGAEYLSAEVLQNLRSLLDNWVCEQIQTFGGLDTFLGTFFDKNAPRWHQVGRVCFHLAENKNDPDYPFAFMTTYAPELSAQGRVRHQPLSRALQEYAGAKNKKALIRLLSPVQLAAESSPVIKELVDTGDLYHPLAWTPAEAYLFLKDAAL